MVYKQIKLSKSQIECSEVIFDQMKQTVAELRVSLERKTWTPHPCKAPISV